MGPPLAVRTPVRYVVGMPTEQQLNQLTARHAVFVTTASHMRHPRDDYEGWRRDWADVIRLADEINRLVRLDTHMPA